MKGPSIQYNLFRQVSIPTNTLRSISEKIPDSLYKVWVDVQINQSWSLHSTTVVSYHRHQHTVPLLSRKSGKETREEKKRKKGESKRPQGNKVNVQWRLHTQHVVKCSQYSSTWCARARVWVSINCLLAHVDLNRSIRQFTNCTLFLLTVRYFY